MEIRKMECPEEKKGLKCPYEMTATRVVIHNTANDASAENEIRYMHSNNKSVSFHFAVDDKEAVQGIELNRNAWHAGDGNGKGNREGIAIEICYSKSGGERFEKAQRNAAELTARILEERGWGLERVTKHQDYNGKSCPHRTLEEYGWEYFIGLVREAMTGEKNAEGGEKKEGTNRILKWQEAAIADGFKFPKYGADGIWGSECEGVAKKAICKKRSVYKYQSLTKIVQEAVGVTADGKFGNESYGAVIRFQKANGLSADGEVGIKTWKKILGV